MKVKIKKIMVAILAIIMMNTSMVSNVLIANAASSYDSSKALAYAQAHWNTDKSQLCAEFVSNCLKSGGISSWSKSCTALRKQLINSGAGQEYEIKLQSDKTIKASNYSGKLEKGDVVFYYCSGCANKNGKPYIHAVLCNGSDSNGYMKAYSHNNANSGKTKYKYSSKCSICGTTITKAYVYHFKSALDINFESEKYELSANQQKNIPFTFKGDGIATLSYSIGNSKICSAEWGSVDWNTGKANLKVTPKSAGQTIITVSLQDSNNKALYQKSFEIVVGVESGSVNISQDNITLNLTDNNTGTVNLNWTYKTCERILQNFDKNIVSITYDNLTSSSVRLKIEALKAGTTTDEVTIVDAQGNKLGTAKITIVVEEAKVEEQSQESKTFNINFETEKYVLSQGEEKEIQFTFSSDGVATMAYNTSEISVCSVENGGASWKKGIAIIKLKAKSAGTSTITVILQDENNNALYQKSFEVVVEETKVEEQQPQEHNDFTVNLDSEQYELTSGVQKEIQFTFSGDGINTLAYRTSDSNICQLESGDIDWSKGSAKLKLIPKSAGTSTITVILRDKNTNELYQKNFSVVVGTENGSVNFDKEDITLDLANNKVENVGMTWTYSSVERIEQNFDKNIASITYDNLTSNSVRLNITAKNEGTTTDELILKDKYGNILAVKQINITVTDIKVQEATSEATEPEEPVVEETKTEEPVTEEAKSEEQKPQANSSFSINFGSSKYNLYSGQQTDIQFTFKGDGIASMAFSSTNEDVCDVSWGNVDWNTCKATMSINPKIVGTTTITVMLKDSDDNTLCEKSFDITVNVENGNISFSQQNITLNIADKKSVNLTWSFKNGERILEDFDKDIVDVTFSDIALNSVKICFEGLKEGTTVDEVTILDSFGNKLGTARINIVVESAKTE